MATYYEIIIVCIKVQGIHNERKVLPDIRND